MKCDTVRSQTMSQAIAAAGGTVFPGCCLERVRMMAASLHPMAHQHITLPSPSTP